MIPVNFFEQTHVYNSVFETAPAKSKISSRFKPKYNIPKLAKALEFLRREVSDYEKLKLINEDVALLKETVHMSIDDAKSLLELVERVLKG